MSKLGIVVKYKNNPESGKVKKKVRIILDNKESGVTVVAKRTHKSTLPRATHAVAGALGLAAPDLMLGARSNKACRQKEHFLTADVSDVFWLVLSIHRRGVSLWLNIRANGLCLFGQHKVFVVLL